MRLLGPVAALSAMAHPLSAYRRFVAIHHSRYVTFVMSCFVEDGNLVTFILGEVYVFHSWQL
jgi:hypothetical protein